MSVENLQNEEWRTCRVCNYYAVSNFGRLKRCSGFKSGARIGLVQKAKITTNGYSSYVLYGDGRKYYKTAHMLVADAFLGLKPFGMEINHKDGNKQNNYVGNLEYCTQQENKKHAVVNNLTCYGERQHCAKITLNTAKQIKTMYKSGIRQIDIYKRLNLPKHIVYDICLERSWRRVTV